MFSDAKNSNACSLHVVFKQTLFMSTQVSNTASEYEKARRGPTKTETCHIVKHTGTCFGLSVSRNIAGGKANSGIVPTPAMN